MSAKMMEPLATANSNLPVLANGQKFFLANAHLQAQGFRAMMRYQIELLNFLKQRFEQDVKFVNDLASSHEFNDAFDVVSDFMQNATTEYAAEAGKIATIGSRLASETARRMREQAGEAVDDLAAKTVA